MLIVFGLSICINLCSKDIFLPVDVEFLSNELENLYKIVHLVNFNTSIQALMLLYQVMDTRYVVKRHNHVTSRTKYFTL